MRDPVVDEERHVWVRDKVERFLGGRVGSHYYCGWGRVGWCREIGVVHKGDVGEEVGACCEMELLKLAQVTGVWGWERRGIAYESGVLETLNDFWGESAGGLEVRGACWGFVVEGYFCCHLNVLLLPLEGVCLNEVIELFGRGERDRGSIPLIVEFSV
jgi:hypothetical protein